MNQMIKKYLRAFINYRQDDWKEWLSLGEFAYNNSEHAATHQTPFFLNRGQHPWTGTDTRLETRNETADQFAKKMKRIREEARAALKQASEKVKHAHDKHTRKSIEYQPGDRVYLEVTNI
jgi:DNA anti-recombination protein RmuC